MKETADGTLILDRNDLEKLAARCDWAVELMREVPDGTRLSWDAVARLSDEARYMHEQLGPLTPALKRRWRRARRRAHPELFGGEE